MTSSCIYRKLIQMEKKCSRECGSMPAPLPGEVRRHYGGGVGPASSSFNRRWDGPPPSPSHLPSSAQFCRWLRICYNEEMFLPCLESSSGCCDPVFPNCSYDIHTETEQVLGHIRTHVQGFSGHCLGERQWRAYGLKLQLLSGSKCALCAMECDTLHNIIG